jgi:cytochrome b561
MTASKFVELSRRAIWLDRISAPGLGSWMLALAYVAGVAGILQDRIGLHIVFGLLLWLAVVARFAERRNQSRATHVIELREFRRQVSRTVYLLLYLLFGLNLLIHMGAAENLRDYLGYGILALVTIQTLAALERRSDHQHHK